MTKPPVPPPTALEHREEGADRRLRSPSAARNRGPILEVMERVLPPWGRALEIGSGTGEHVVFFAAGIPGLSWQPSDPDAASRESIAAWIAAEELTNVAPPVNIDVRAPHWGVEEEDLFDVLVSLNMIHIAPWEAALGLFAGAGRLLRSGGVLFLYGPFKRDGITAPSNEAFDASLKARDPSWGVRDIVEIERALAPHGLTLAECVEMPANNLSLVFER